ncbi:hypothetical protein HU200_059873 [Digitaria exilis]|uniref:Pentatricopeptide repeat-containing protein n=1 Tax=Digitaria exilis TaxID=1010633 RepID=A0A835AAP9_9POAL|nr:hypothetical protein HU200_059873 [Digitaria exilis]
MIKKGIVPNTRTFNIFIHSLCIRGKLSVAKNMVYNQVFPANVVTYNTLIHWFYNHGKFSEAEEVFMYVKEAANIVPDEVTYTIMVDGLCRQGKFDKATACYKEYLKFRLSKDLLTVLVKRLVHSDRIWNIIDALREIERQGFVHDISAFNSAISRSFSRDGYCRYRKISDLEFLLDAILGPDKEVYSSHKSKEKVNHGQDVKRYFLEFSVNFKYDPVHIEFPFVEYDPYMQQDHIIKNGD